MCTQPLLQLFRFLNCINNNANSVCTFLVFVELQRQENERVAQANAQPNQLVLLPDLALWVPAQHWLGPREQEHIDNIPVYATAKVWLKHPELESHAAKSRTGACTNVCLLAAAMNVNDMHVIDFT